MRYFGYALGCLFVTLIASAQAREEAVFGTAELDRWMNTYYLEPKPEEVPRALRTIDTTDAFKRENAHAPLAGFFMEIFASNPERIAGWIAPYLRGPRQEFLYSALWFADSPQSRAALRRLAEYSPPEQAKQITELLALDPPDIGSSEDTSAGDLDFLWGRYAASGKELPVIRIIRQTRRLKGPDRQGMAVGAAARVSLTSVAITHERVRIIIEDQATRGDPEDRQVLRELLEKLGPRNSPAPTP